VQARDLEQDPARGAAAPAEQGALVL